MDQTIAFTGHRPERLDTNAYSVVFDWLSSRRPAKVISGMAQGIDMFAAEAAILLKIPLVAAMPWTTHGELRDKSQKAKYDWVLENAADIVVTGPYDSFSLEAFFVRNRWMVDNCDLLVSYWDGKRDGGTYDAICYARKVGRPIKHLWRED